MARAFAVTASRDDLSTALATAGLARLAYPVGHSTPLVAVLVEALSSAIALAALGPLGALAASLADNALDTDLALVAVELAGRGEVDNAGVGGLGQRLGQCLVGGANLASGQHHVEEPVLVLGNKRHLVAVDDGADGANRQISGPARGKIFSLHVGILCHICILCKQKRGEFLEDVFMGLTARLSQLRHIIKPQASFPGHPSRNCPL